MEKHLDASFDIEETYRYEAIWATLFQLKFSSAKGLIESWSPEKTFDKARQLILKEFIGIDTGKQYKSMLRSDDYINKMDYIYVRHMLRTIKGEWDDVKEESKQNAGLQTYHKIIDDLMKEIIKPDDITSYGNKHQILNMDSDDSDLIPYLKILNSLIELALFTDFSNVIFLDKKKWILICEKLMNRYPLPCLFFTLLYGNDKTLIKKVAQLYLYSSTLRATMPKLLHMMLDALLDDHCPYNVRVAIRLAAPIFMKAVPSEQWLSQYERLFKNFNWDNERLVHDIDNEFHFFKSSMPYIKDEKFKLYVATTCLQRAAKIDHFCNEMLLTSRKGVSLKKPEIRSLLVELIKIANEPAHFYVLLNMSSCLPQKKLAKKLLDRPDTQYAILC
jgi:hypothetical protein